MDRRPCLLLHSPLAPRRLRSFKITSRFSGRTKKTAIDFASDAYNILVVRPKQWSRPMSTTKEKGQLAGHARASHHRDFQPVVSVSGSPLL